MDFGCNTPKCVFGMWGRKAFREEIEKTMSGEKG